MIEHIKHIPNVKECFPMLNSIFSNMNYELPMDPAQMDLLFYTDFGLKTVCPLVLTLKEDDATLTNEKLILLATMLLNKYKNKWDRDQAVAQAEYDPMHNYLDEYAETGSNTEDESGSENSSETWNESIDGHNSMTRTDNLSQVDSGSFSSTDTATDHQDRFGLNSTTAVGVTEGGNSVTNSGTNGNTRTNTGTQTDAEVRDEDRYITDTKGITTTKDNDKTHQKEGYHRGNIGNISTQKLLIEEIDLWRWNVVDEMLRDARDFLTIPIYHFCG